MFFRLEGVHIGAGALTLLTGLTFMSGWYKGGKTEINLNLNLSSNRQGGDATADYTAA
jgi:hypothetical protein